VSAFKETDYVSLFQDKRKIVEEENDMQRWAFREVGVAGLM